MGRTAKIAGVAALAGIMLTVGIVAASRPPADGPAEVARPAPGAAVPPIDMSRCRVITMPDSGCEAAWETKRRRFFGRDAR